MNIVHVLIIITFVQYVNIFFKILFFVLFMNIFKVNDNFCYIIVLHGGENMDKLRTRLKALREDNDLNQQDLATEFCIPRSTLAGYETGKSLPPYDILIKYALRFNTTTDYILGVEDINSRKKISSTNEIKIVHDEDVPFNKAQLEFLEKIIKNHKDDLMKK